MKRAIILAVVLSAAAYLAWHLNHCLRPPLAKPALEPITVFCAVNLKKPVEAAAVEFQRETGIAVQFQFGGSGTLLSQLRIAKTGDLFFAADQGWMDDARKLGLVGEVFPLARQHPVIAVRAGNPKNVRTLADLMRADLKVAVANPEAASIGRVTKSALGPQWEPLAAKVTVMKPTVTDIASDLSLGAVDAAILWDSTVPQFKEIEAVEVPELSARVEVAPAGVLVSSQHAASAVLFAKWLVAPEKGGVIFKKAGFSAPGGEGGK